MKTQFVSRRGLVLTVIASLFTIVSCQKSSSNAPGVTGQSSVNIYIADDPSLVFDKVLLDIQKIEIKIEDSTEIENEAKHEAQEDANDQHGDASSTWSTLSIHAGVYDILQFRNGLDTLFANSSFPTNKHLQKVRVTLGTNNSVVFNGTSFPLTVKNNDNFIVIKLNESSTQINNGAASNIWIDIDAGNSIRKNGNNFILKPSVKLFSKEKAGSIEGRVLPGDASAMVMAINGTDTATAKPELEGEYKFIGLKAGVYNVVFHATANAYIDQTITNVTVREKDDTKLPTVTLTK
jgi:hypothetical protein